MAVRKYGISRNDFRSEQRWNVQGGQEIEPGAAGFVTAYDARDVAPLVKAARKAAEDLGKVANQFQALAPEGRNHLLFEAKEKRLREALAPFDSEEKT